MDSGDRREEFRMFGQHPDGTHGDSYPIGQQAKPPGPYDFAFKQAVSWGRGMALLSHSKIFKEYRLT